MQDCTCIGVLKTAMHCILCMEIYGQCIVMVSMEHFTVGTMHVS